MKELHEVFILFIIAFQKQVRKFGFLPLYDRLGKSKLYRDTSQQNFISSTSTIGRVEKGVKSVQV